MLEWILAICMAFSCPGHMNTAHDTHHQITALDDTGGDTGTIPPNPPKGH